MAQKKGYWLALKFAVLFVTVAYVHCGTEVMRPRGVPLIRAPMYDASKAFTCFDGSNQIPFEYVNDDYCDCHDGSDEPGTAACATGVFHCTNRGFRSSEIPTSRVNDGICDCCDGTDEFDLKITCPNECLEFGKHMREEAERQLTALRLGYQKRLEFVETVKTKKAEKTTKLVSLDSELTDMDAQKAALTQARDDAEAPEKIAIDKHKERWEAAKKELELQQEKGHAEEAFKSISADPHLLSKENLETKLGKEGETLNEEVHEAIHRLSDMTLEVFTEDLWPKIKSVYRQLQDSPATTPASEESHATTPSPSDDYSDDHETDYDKEFDEEHQEENVEVPVEPIPPRHRRHHHHQVKHEESTDSSMPEYDVETKALVDAAEKARQDLRDFEKRIGDLENERNAIKRWLENDYGPDSVFAALEGECYEYTDREYTYRVCPFDKVVQKPKDGGSDTGLGKWGNWEENYTVMLFNDGARCWNGPARSTKVRLECGADHEVHSALEPSRCEYQMTLRTPAVCTEPPQNISAHLGLHDEL